MKKSIIILIAVIFVLAIAFIVLRDRRVVGDAKVDSMSAANALPSSANPNARIVLEKNEESGQMNEVGDSLVVESAEEKTHKNGIYVSYVPERLTQKGGEKFVLFFHASWCPTCRALDSDIRAHVSDIPDGVTILDVDYDHSFELKKKYGVTYQHTLVQVDNKGTLIKKWSGSPTLSAFLGEIQ